MYIFTYKKFHALCVYECDLSEIIRTRAATSITKLFRAFINIVLLAFTITDPEVGAGPKDNGYCNWNLLTWFIELSATYFFREIKAFSPTTFQIKIHQFCVA